MARTVPGRNVAGGQEGVRIPDVLKHMAGQAIVAGGALPAGPAGQWRDVGLARNLAWVADGMGAAVGMAWRTGGLVGVLADTMQLRIPVPDADHARLRLRVWAEGHPDNNAAISIATATVGPASVVVGNGANTRYPAPGADVIIDSGPDVVVDADAGPYVDVELATTGTWGGLFSVHVDLVEAGAPAAYPTDDTTLAAGIVGDFVPADTDDYAAGLPLGADTLFETLEQWGEQWGRRKVALHWAEFDRVGGEMPPRRLRSVIRVPAGAGTRVTIAAYVPDTTNGTHVTLYRDDLAPARPGAYLMRLDVPAAAAPGWFMVTQELRVEGVDLGSPSAGLDALASVIVRARGADPITDGGGVGDVRQIEGAGTADPVLSVVVWVG